MANVLSCIRLAKVTGTEEPSGPSRAIDAGHPPNFKWDSTIGSLSRASSGVSCCVCVGVRGNSWKLRRWRWRWHWHYSRSDPQFDA